MRHRSISPRVRLTVLLAAIAATVGCESTAHATAPELPQLDPLTVVGTYDLINQLPWTVECTKVVCHTVVAERLTIDLARTWGLIRVDHYVTGEVQSDTEKTALSGTWKVQGSSLTLSASDGELFVEPHGDQLTMWEECKSANWLDCFYSPILYWRKQPPAVGP